MVNCVQGLIRSKHSCCWLLLNAADGLLGRLVVEKDFEAGDCIPTAASAITTAARDEHRFQQGAAKCDDDPTGDVLDWIEKQGIPI